jgi:hypothetical protein
MTISSAMTVAAVQTAQPVAPPVASPRETPVPTAAHQTGRPVATEILPTQPVAMPPVVTALTADFKAGRVAAEAARAAYLAERRQSQR